MPPSDTIDWQAERGRAARHTQRSLIALARRAGWTVQPGRGKGSHVLLTKPGAARPVVIQQRMYRNAALSIIDQLEEGSD